MDNQETPDKWEEPGTQENPRSYWTERKQVIQTMREFFSPARTQEDDLPHTSWDSYRRRRKPRRGSTRCKEQRLQLRTARKRRPQMKPGPRSATWVAPGETRSPVSQAAWETGSMWACDESTRGTPGWLSQEAVWLSISGCWVQASARDRDYLKIKFLICWLYITL